MVRIGGFMGRLVPVLLIAVFFLPTKGRAEDICVGALDGVQTANPPSGSSSGNFMLKPTTIKDYVAFDNCMRMQNLGNTFSSETLKRSYCERKSTVTKPSNFGSLTNQNTKAPLYFGRCKIGSVLTTREYLMSKCYSADGAWVGSNDPKCGKLSVAPAKFDYKIAREVHTLLHAKAECKAGGKVLPDITDQAECEKKKGQFTSQKDVIKRENSIAERESEKLKGGKSLLGQKALLNNDLEDKKISYTLADQQHQDNLAQLKVANKTLHDDENALKKATKEQKKNADLISNYQDEIKTNGQLPPEEKKKYDALVTRNQELEKEINDPTTGLTQRVKEDNAAVTNINKSIEGPNGSQQALKEAEEKRDSAQEKYDTQFADSNAIQEVNTNEEYGGKYGGASVSTSQAINMAATQVSGAAEAVGGQKVQMAAQDREAALRQQGAMSTNLEQVNAARHDVADEAKKSLKAGGFIDMAMGLYQGFRAGQHLKSVKEVEGAASQAEVEINTRMSEKSLTEADALAKKENVQNNLAGESKAQSDAAIAQGMAAAAMAYKGVTKFQQAAAISAIEAQNNANAHQFGFAMGGGITQGGGQDGVNSLSPVQSAVTTEEEGKKEDLAQNSNINPNDPNLVPDGPPAGAFVESKDQGGGGGGGGGPGMAGGTSADKSAMEAGAQGPAANTKAGSYAAVAGSGGYKSKNGGGAGKAGVDTGFADLLKKFLPGSEPEKKKGPGELQFGDRSPASSQTAVIGRNKNIFEEISKRYQKKSAEGSVF